MRKRRKKVDWENLSWVGFDLEKYYDEKWDLSERPHTLTKLGILGDYYHIWMTIWNSQPWAEREWYYVDLFAGRGFYSQKTSDGMNFLPGSPLIFLNCVADLYNRNKPIPDRINLLLVEKNRHNATLLKKLIDSFVYAYPKLESHIYYEIFPNDCNEISNEIVKKIKNSSKTPLFLLIDPYGLQIKIETFKKFLRLSNPKDILFNFILEGIKRVKGFADKCLTKEGLSVKEIKTIKTLEEFMGADTEVIPRGDLEILRLFVETNFKGLKVVAFDMPYPSRRDVIYYLLFASKKSNIVKIVRDIYARHKHAGRPSLFGPEIYKKTLVSFNEDSVDEGSISDGVYRKSLLYRTKVEYSDWTINHILGCAHGCRFPCYAYMMAKRFGWIRSYDEWLRPRPVKNALELLERELLKYRGQIKKVHLCFMTDPFMFDAKRNSLVPEVVNLTLAILKKLNENGIQVTTLTKGYYPEVVTELSENNEYGITLISLNPEFKKNFEPYSAPYELRLESLRRLAARGFKTWVSIEPYPTPNLDQQAPFVEKLLERLDFVNRIVFGKLNYNVTSKRYKNNEDFYRKMVTKIVDFCERNGIEYHIKQGTPVP